MGASCGGDDRFGAGRDELLLRDARELIEPAEVVGQGSDVALLQRADVRVGGRSVRGPTALGQLGCEMGPPPLAEAEPGDGFEEAAERDLHVEGAVVGGVSVDEELAQAGLALVGDAVDLAVTFLVAAAGLRLARRRFALVTQGRQLTADSAGHRADGPGPGVINRADGAGQLEPVERWVEGAERDAAGPASERGNLLFQFIAVRLVLFEDPEDRHLDHEVRVSIRYIEAATIVLQALSIWGSTSVSFRCSTRLRWSCIPISWLRGRRLSERGRSCVGWCSPVGRDLVWGRLGGRSSRSCRWLVSPCWNVPCGTWSTSESMRWSSWWGIGPRRSSSFALGCRCGSVPPCDACATLGSTKATGCRCWLPRKPWGASRSYWSWPTTCSTGRSCGRCWVRRCRPMVRCLQSTT